MTSYAIRRMTAADVPGVVTLQALAFPPPFNSDFHWDPEHLLRHIETFPEGQLVAEADGSVVGSCSNSIVSEERWQAHGSWGATVGGPALRYFDPAGSTLYGLDIAVHPSFRLRGIARAFYGTRFQIVRQRGMVRYGTGCRMPGWAAWSSANEGKGQEEYAAAVAAGVLQDRTLTPLLKMGLRLVGVIPNYMPDPESGDAGALLEWVLENAESLTLRGGFTDR